MLNLVNLYSHVIETLRDPRGQARWIMSVDLPRAMRWEAMAIVVLMSTILSYGAGQLAPPQPPTVWDPILNSPYLLATVQMSGLVITVFAVYWVGRLGGGSARFADCILIIAWIQFVLFCLQVIQTIAAFAAPSLAGMIGIVAIVVLFWLMTNFIAEVHGFKSLTKVFAMIIATLMGFAFGLSVILSMIGFSAS